MKKQLFSRSKIALNALVLGIASLLLIPASAFAALAPSVSLSSSASSVIIHNNVVVTMNVNVGDLTDGGEVKVNYDAAKLTYVSSDYAGTPFNSDSPDASAGSGTIIVSRYANSPPGPSGSFVMVKFTFNAAVSTGSASISIDGPASYFSDHNNSGAAVVPSSVNGTTISFQPAPSAPVTTPVTTPTTGSTTTTPAKTTTTTPAKTTTTPTKTTTTTTTTPTQTVTETPAATETTTDTTATSPDGDPVPAVPVAKKMNTKLFAIGGGTLVVVAAIAAVFTMMRRRSMMGVIGGSSHSVINQPAAPVLPPDAPLNKIPSVETRAPGEVVQPQPTDNHPPVG